MSGLRFYHQNRFKSFQTEYPYLEILLVKIIRTLIRGLTYGDDEVGRTLGDMKGTESAERTGFIRGRTKRNDTLGWVKNSNGFVGTPIVDLLRVHLCLPCEVPLETPFELFREKWFNIRSSPCDCSISHHRVLIIVLL